MRHQQQHPEEFFPFLQSTYLHEVRPELLSYISFSISAKILFQTPQLYPEEHCKKAPELLAAGGVGDDMIHSICSHGYGICCDAEPNCEMEKVLFAADELTGLIWSTALMRPSKSVSDMDISSIKKKFKDKKFAAGCSRDIIRTGAERLGWELDRLFEQTLLAMRDCEASVNEFMDGYTK